MNEVMRAREAHDKAVDDYRKAIVELANAEFNYDVEMASAIAAERNAGTPVTIAEKMARGVESVAERRSEVSLRTGFQRAAQARVQSTYLELKYAMEVEEREWRQSGIGGFDGA